MDLSPTVYKLPPSPFTSCLAPNHESRGVRPGQRDKKLSGSALALFGRGNKATLRGSCALERATGNKSECNCMNTSNGIRTHIFPLLQCILESSRIKEKYSVIRKLMSAEWVTKAICSWGGLCVWDYGVIRREALPVGARDWHQSMLYIDRSSLLCTACHREWFFLSRSAVDSSFISVFGHCSARRASWHSLNILDNILTIYISSFFDSWLLHSQNLSQW